MPGTVNYRNLTLLTGTIRMFGDSGAGARGMRYYTVIYGADGKRNVVPKRRLPRLPPANGTAELAEKPPIPGLYGA